MPQPKQSKRSTSRYEKSRHKDTILAVQCSDHCIRIYAVTSLFDEHGVANTNACTPVVLQRSTSSSSNSSNGGNYANSSSKSVYNQGDVKENDRVVPTTSSIMSNFLHPLRILEGHRTGDWSIKLNFIRGPYYSLELPAYMKSSMLTDSSQMSTSGGHHHMKGNSPHQKPSKNHSTLGGVLNDSPPHHISKVYRNIIPVDSGSDFQAASNV